MLNPCNMCWSDAVKTEAVWVWERDEDGNGVNVIKGSKEAEGIKGYEFGTILHCPCCSPDVTEHDRFDVAYGYDGDELYYEKEWQEANPISHAGKMLVEDSIDGDYDISENFDLWCKNCDAETKIMFDETEETDGDLTFEHHMRIEHDSTCPLITGAKLPLKVKIGE